MDQVLKWALAHQADRKKVEAIVRKLGFERDPKDTAVWVKKVSQGAFWRETKIRVREREVLMFIHKAQKEATETYFEYLVVCGFLAGKLASRMEMLPRVTAAVTEDVDELDDPQCDGWDDDE